MPDDLHDEPMAVAQREDDVVDEADRGAEGRVAVAPFPDRHRVHELLARNDHEGAAREERHDHQGRRRRSAGGPRACPGPDRPSARRASSTASAMGAARVTPEYLALAARPAPTAASAKRPRVGFSSARTTRSSVPDDPQQEKGLDEGPVRVAHGAEAHGHEERRQQAGAPRAEPLAEPPGRRGWSRRRSRPRASARSGPGPPGYPFGSGLR